MSLDLAQDEDALPGRGGTVVRAQEPEARDALLVDEAIDLLGEGSLIWPGCAHVTVDDTAGRAGQIAEPAPSGSARRGTLTCTLRGVDGPRSHDRSII